MQKLLFLVALFHVTTTNFSERSTWEDHKAKFRLDFPPEEEEKRFQIFKNNLKTIEKLNKLNLGYTVGINKFSSLVLVFSTQLNWQFFNVSGRPVDSIEEEVNWVKRGVVTPVMDQGACNACWAISTIGAIEGAYAIKYGDLKSFSVQQLLDCSYEKNGCNKGQRSKAMRYVKFHGVTTNDDYPYSGHNGTCKLDHKSIRVFISRYAQLPHSAHALDNALKRVGPISVAIDAEPTEFQFYTSGIFQSPNCKSNSVNHAVLLVGYGYDLIAKQQYYLLKNSWGVDWGMDGYFKLLRHGTNDCGVSLEPIYPIL